MHEYICICVYIYISLSIYIYIYMYVGLAQGAHRAVALGARLFALLFMQCY